VLTSQSNRASLVFLLFSFPAYDLQDHSLVFFSAISMKHALSCAVRSKKIIYTNMSRSLFDTILKLESPLPPLSVRPFGDNVHHHITLTNFFYMISLLCYYRPSACSFGLSATSQQYFSLRTNQPPAIRQQYFSLRTNQHQSSATSQTNRLPS
jgi:hypothetical protein